MLSLSVQIKKIPSSLRISSYLCFQSSFVIHLPFWLSSVLPVFPDVICHVSTCQCRELDVLHYVSWEPCSLKCVIQPKIQHTKYNNRITLKHNLVRKQMTRPACNMSPRPRWSIKYAPLQFSFLYCQCPREAWGGAEGKDSQVPMEFPGCWGIGFPGTLNLVMLAVAMFCSC